MQNNPWLAWKMKHGLAVRGRVGGRLHPKGLLSGLLYKLWFKRYDTPLEDPQIFRQNVGGSVGPEGGLK